MGRPKKNASLTQNLQQKDTMHWNSSTRQHALPPAKLRYDQSNHFPIRMLKTKAMSCQHEGCEKQTVFRCLKCNVVLCIGTRESTNCFYKFHIKISAIQGCETDQEHINKKIDQEPDLQVVELDDPLNVSTSENCKSKLLDNASNFHTNNTKWPKGVSQPFVLISKLDLSPISSTSSHVDAPSLVEDSENVLLNDIGKTPIRGRSGRAIKPKLDPNFKYLPAGAKKHALNFGIASQSNDGPQLINSRGKTKKNSKTYIEKPKNIPLHPLSIKTEFGNNMTSLPRLHKSGHNKKRKLKPLNSISSRYLKIRRNKYKTDNFSKNSSKYMPPPTISTKVPSDELKPSAMVLNTFNASSSNYQYQVEQSAEINLEPQISSMYALQTFDRAPSPEAILPDDIPSHQFNVTGNFISGINQNNGYILNNSYYQNGDIKEESIEICDNGLGASYTVTSGEAVLDFTMF